MSINLDLTFPSSELNLGYSAFPDTSYDQTTLTGLPGSLKWAGSCLAANEKIYCAPFNASSVLIIDTVAETIDTTTIPFPAGSFKCAGAIYAPNGKIYFIPQSLTYVPIIDPATDTLDITTITGLAVGINKWLGACLVGDKIYCSPSFSDSVLVIDTSNDTFYLIGGLGTAGAKWYGAIRAENGKLYCPPQGLGPGTSSVLIIDPSDDTLDTTTISGLAGIRLYFSGALAQNGKIYCAGYLSTSFLKIDPDTDTVSNIAGPVGSYVGVNLAANGLLYSFPDSGASPGLVTIDPFTDILANETFPSNPGTDLLRGGCIGVKNKLFTPPFNDTYVGILTCGAPTLPDRFALSATTNKQL